MSETRKLKKLIRISRKHYEQLTLFRGELSTSGKLHEILTTYFQGKGNEREIKQIKQQLKKYGDEAV